MNIEDYYKDIKDNWWEKHNPQANWEELYKSYPDVDFAEFYSQLPKALIPEEVDDGQGY